MNTYNIFSDINKILSSETALDRNQKVFFSVLAEELEKRQTELFKVLQENTINALRNTKEINPVVTMLSADPAYESKDFFPMPFDGENEESIVFIDCPAEELKEDDEYPLNGTDAKIKVERVTGFIKAERIISSIFRAYNICQPYIFSPYSRRAYRVTVFDEEANDYVPLNIKKNNICSKIKNVSVGKLFWNIEILPLAKFRAENVVVNNNEFVRFNNCDNNTFIWLDSSDESVIFKKCADSQYIDISKEDYEKYRPDLIKVIIHKPDPWAKNCFKNISDQTVLAPERIISAADLRLAVQKYYPEPSEYKGCLEEKNNNKVKVYTEEYRYNYEELSPAIVKNKVVYYLKFENSGKDQFFADRVSFFISFMRYNYPNFYWVGVQ